MTEPVVIVGAGPTGLALACCLLRQGTEVRIIDQALNPTTTSRAMSMQPGGAEVLRRLGVLAELSERSLRVEEIVVHFYSGETVRIDTNRRAPGNAPSGMLISQAEVETALRRRLGDLGGEVEWGREFIDAIPRSDGLTVCVAGNENIQASWLIGCDGAHSRVRKSAGIKFAGAPLGAIPSR